MGRDEPDRLTRIQRHRNSNRAAPHHAESASMIIDLDRLEVSRKFQNVHGRGDCSPGEPRNADMTLIRVRGDLPVPSTLKAVGEVVQRGWVADLLDGQGVWSLVIDGRCQPLNFGVVGCLSRRSRSSTRLEQVFDVPGHHLEHWCGSFGWGSTAALK